MQEYELTLKLKTGTMRKNNKTWPGTTKKSESVLDQEPVPVVYTKLCTLNCAH